ncbi:MAG TPA: hypothetical protein VEA16_13805 [Vicinamibacterales bacterium]|nr:hypothetical protein [Vicinamibacterales bacterium]
MSFVAALTIVVHVSNLAAVPDPVIRAAQSEVAALFLDAGVEIRWVDDVVPGGARVEARLILVPHASGAHRDAGGKAIFGAASRTPGGMGTAWVFYQRITQHAERYSVPASRLLACAIAHELGHVIQDTPSHSASGVMRATWRMRDYRQAALGRLRFTEIDSAAFALRLRGDAVERGRGTDDQAAAVNRR